MIFDICFHYSMWAASIFRSNCFFFYLISSIQFEMSNQFFLGFFSSFFLKSRLLFGRFSHVWLYSLCCFFFELEDIIHYSLMPYTSFFFVLFNWAHTFTPSGQLCGVRNNNLFCQSFTSLIWFGHILFGYFNGCFTVKHLCLLKSRTAITTKSSANDISLSCGFIFFLEVEE